MMLVAFIAMILLCALGAWLRFAVSRERRNIRVRRSFSYLMVIARMKLLSDALFLFGGIFGYLLAQMLTGVAQTVLNAAAIAFIGFVVGFLMVKDYWWRRRAKRLEMKYCRLDDMYD